METVKIDKPEKVKKSETSVDHYIDQAAEKLLDIHTHISKFNQELCEPKLDLATDKLAQVMSLLGARNKERRKAGTYGKS